MGGLRHGSTLGTCFSGGTTIIVRCYIKPVRIECWCTSSYGSKVIGRSGCKIFASGGWSHMQSEPGMMRLRLSCLNWQARPAQMISQTRPAQMIFRNITGLGPCHIDAVSCLCASAVLSKQAKRGCIRFTNPFSSNSSVILTIALQAHPQSPSQKNHPGLPYHSGKICPARPDSTTALPPLMTPPLHTRSLHPRSLTYIVSIQCSGIKSRSLPYADNCIASLVSD